MLDIFFGAFWRDRCSANKKVPTRIIRNEIVIVKSEIVQSGAQPIRVNYALSQSSGKWLVFDIVIEGVSLVTNYRSQFSSEIRRNGMDALINKLVKKNKGKD